MKGIEHTWPSDQELLEIAAAHDGIIAHAAVTLGVSSSTLRSHLARRDLVERFKAYKTARVVAGPVPGDQVSPLEVLQQENAELRRQIGSARNDDVREERVIQAITEHLPVRQPRYKPARLPVNGKRKHAPHTLVLLWSDLHAAEVVSADETNGANSYNWDIMLRRHDELRRGVLSFAERFGPVDELVILALGDMLSGNIHDELAETNEMPLSEATVQLGLDGADWIETFVEHFPKIRFAGVVGNHPRAHHKPRAKQKYDNGDWVTYQVMRQRLSKCESVTFEVPKPQKFPIMIHNRRLLAMHGDGIRSTMTDVPWGGIIRHVNKLSNQYSQMGIPIDHYCCGHYHEANVVKNRRILMNGSVKGVDEYSMDRFGGGEKPTQLLVPFHPKWGMVGTQYIDLEPAR